MCYALTIYLIFALFGCSSVQPGKSGPPADFKIEIKGDEVIQVAGEYTLDGETNTISGSLPIEIIENGHNISFNLHRVEGDGAIVVNCFVNERESCACANSRENAYIEGAADASTSWIRSK
jgi:hypothetical protein